MTAHSLIGAEVKVLATAKGAISSATTTSFDFGTPDDLYLPTSAFRSADRIILLLDASTAGTTDSLTWVVQDADDNAGSIGTPATAITNATGGTLAGGTGDDYRVVGVDLQSGRPWLRVRFTSTGATDTFITQCTVLAIPQGL